MAAAISPIWPSGAAVTPDGALAFHGRTAASLLDEFGSPLYLIDTDEVAARARRFVAAAAAAFPTSTTHVSFAGKAFLSKEVVRLVTAAGMLVDTCTMGEMRIALAAGVPGRRLVLHGNNKSDEEIALAIEQGFAKIVVDSPDEPARIAAIARRLGKRARVMLRVTCGIHAGGHEYISTAHEDQKFGVPLLPAGADAGVLGMLDELGEGRTDHLDREGRTDHPQSRLTTAGAQASAGSRWRELSAQQTEGGLAAHPTGDQPAASAANLHDGHALRHDVRYPYDLRAADVSDEDRALAAAMEAVADGPALAVLKDMLRRPELELVGIHSHIGSQIHDATAFVQAARRMMLLRKTFYATDAYTLPEVDLGGGYSVAYTDGEDSMDIEAELGRLAQAVAKVNRALGMPAPVVSFEPGRWIVAPAGVTLYRVGTVKPVRLPAGTVDSAGAPIDERTYVSVDGGMSDNIRPALYGADYTARLANRAGSAETMLARVVGMHCESGDILVHECRLPADTRRGDILAVPVTGAYGRTMASNYNQALIPAVVAVGEAGAHGMLRRQTIDDLLALDVSE
ncbi:diaminopimelate decarboxylase [Bifidobacterium pullorum subsp. saeculare]|uniref:Diaminopimelate decarboxylase n=1 Tax=Bifidobacterium pullorum subsp. saeculare TaxID=78257 RepID=A0A938WY69_9BIFI|nr:diaminopimelate decarboxylase [Bifidobacterium pullorum]MBM6699832.1 diaminopimelate decarboxylase [Bifidobacterium pullorum subsp. saeculare]